MPNTMKRVVKLTLVNLAPNVDDANAMEHSQDFSQLASSCLHSCTTAATILQKQKSPSMMCKLFYGKKDDDSDTLKNKLMENLMRYVRPRDRYTALTSLLLKSQAFYKSHSSILDDGEVLPVVDLPRTSKGKPFVPQTAAANEQDESNCYPISVSHQFPYCGIARLVNDVTESNETELGMDIVVFEPLRTDLYRNVDEFLDVFRTSLTDWEWQQIQQCEDQLREFYIRWSIKEAYTKALGLGMHLEFGDFETRIHGVDEEGEEAINSGIWSSVSNTREGIHLRGRVVKQGMETDWSFFFLPLFNDNDDCEAAVGCACVCLGPLASNNDTSSIFKEQIQWTTLGDVMQWHKER